MTTGGIKVHRAVVSCHIYALKGELCDDPKSSYVENKTKLVRLLLAFNSNVHLLELVNWNNLMVEGL